MVGTSTLSSAFRTVTSGSILTDGTEQTILEVSKSGRYSGYLDLTNLVLGDTFILKQYMDIAGSYVLYAADTYSDVQVEPAIYITPKEITTRTLVSVQRTVGVDHTLSYNFIIEEIPTRFIV
jgi:hypothetical protein